MGARVSHAWKNQIQGICQKTGKCGSEIVQKALPLARRSHRATSRSYRFQLG